MFGPDKFGRALGCSLGGNFVHQAVAPCNHVARRRRSLIDDNVFDRLAAAHRDAFIDDGLQRQLFAAAHLEIGRDDRHRAGILDALLQALGRESAEHHRVRRADARASLHRDYAFDRHRHVNYNAVAFFDSQVFQRTGELADPGMQLLVGDVADLAVVAFKNNRPFVFDRCAQMAVQAVVRRVDLAIGKPLVERRVRFVEHLGEWFFPAQVFARQPCPEAFKIALGFSAEGFVSVHAGNAGRLDSGRRWREYPVFNQNGLNTGTWRTHCVCLLFLMKGVVMSCVPLTGY